MMKVWGIYRTEAPISAVSCQFAATWPLRVIVGSQSEEARVLRRKSDITATAQALLEVKEDCPPALRKLVQLKVPGNHCGSCMLQRRRCQDGCLATVVGSRERQTDTHGGKCQETKTLPTMANASNGSICLRWLSKIYMILGKVYLLTRGIRILDRKNEPRETSPPQVIQSLSWKCY